MIEGLKTTQSQLALLITHHFIAAIIDHKGNNYGHCCVFFTREKWDEELLSDMLAMHLFD